MAIALAIPFWQSLHFYLTHRFLHWQPMYRLAHAVHHRNDNVGPWSGLSMHPIEHVVYFSSVLIHLVVASHPLHVILHLQWNALGAATSHAGFECLLFKGRRVVLLGDFFHQLHHRFYNCNLGNGYIPCDRWFGTEYEGTPESMARIRERRRAGRPWHDPVAFGKVDFQTYGLDPVPGIARSAHVNVAPNPRAASSTSTARLAFIRSRGVATASSKGHSCSPAVRYGGVVSSRPRSAGCRRRRRGRAARDG
ncbi:MAG: sterol desaturase family protein [Alphaproteobacteria bacterium]|nr:sterol desaturase family protein [Alphaproteobacteria bacterium]